MKRETIQIEADSVQTLVWIKDKLFDFARGRSYSLDTNEPDHLGYRLRFNFDAAIVSDDGIYVVVYQKLGTKGLLLKHGEILREINRSYYQSDMYEYPVAFFKALNGKVYLIHCPIAYNQLDFEDVETGEIISNIGRNSPDFFHSRLEVSPNHKRLLSKGWIWHPYDQVIAFNLESCLKNPLLLDKPIEFSSIHYEVCTAGFIDDDCVLLGVSDDAEYFNEDEMISGLLKSQLIVWDCKKNAQLDQLSLEAEIGNFIVINDSLILDLYKYPKLIDFKAGRILEQLPEINSGLQSSSLIGHLENLPKTAWNAESKQLAITTVSSIELLSFC